MVCWVLFSGVLGAKLCSCSGKVAGNCLAHRSAVVIRIIGEMCLGGSLLWRGGSVLFAKEG